MDISADFLPVRELLEAGVHLGHKVTHWNPKMRPYIYCKQNQVHIIDVRETIKGVIKAYYFLYNLFKEQEALVLFVGTKRQVASIVEEQAKKTQMPYVTNRWLGGTLTNFYTVRKRLQRLEEIEKWEQDGEIEKFTKKEKASIFREKRRLLRNLDGIRNMNTTPSCAIIVDPALEITAVKETRKVGPVIIGLIDTDGDPELIDIPIPCNDESARAIKIILSKLADAILLGKSILAEKTAGIKKEEVQEQEVKNDKG